MIVGVPKEIKLDEYRVAMLPVGVEELVRRGHQRAGRSRRRHGLRHCPITTTSQPGAELVERRRRKSSAGPT